MITLLILISVIVTLSHIIMTLTNCKKVSFCFNAKRIFLTYAQCPLSKEVLLKFFEETFEPTEFTIGREKHKDGEYHLHAVFIFPEKIHIHDVHKFDLDNYHPNIKKIPTTQALSAFKRYCKKDGDILTNELVVLGARAQLFKDVLDADLTPEFVRANPTIMQFNLSNLRAWLSFAKPNTLVLKNLPKKRHLWLYGKQNTGKTQYQRTLRLLYESPGLLPYNDDYTYVPYGCDLLIGDEYKGQLTPQVLNSICDGGCHVNTKGGSRILGQFRVVICSNYSIRECYQNVSDEIIATILARFEEYAAPLYPPWPMCEL